MLWVSEQSFVLSPFPLSLNDTISVMPLFLFLCNWLGNSKTEWVYFLG